MIVGVDPGKGGAAVLIDDNGILMDFCDFTTVKVRKKSELATQLIANYIRRAWVDDYDWPVDCIYIEKVHSMPKQGVASSFDFGFSTGVMHGFFAAHQIRTELITPQAWKKATGLIGTDKDAARIWCHRRWPEQADTWFKRKKDSGRADAAAIAWVGLQKEKLNE